MVERCASSEHPGWLELRRGLWPDCPDSEHLAEMDCFCARPEQFGQFVAYDAEGEPVGFVEASVRQDYVNGAESSPVGFLEALYVVPKARQRGIGTALVRAAEQWVRGVGCREMASDAAIDNELSHKVHRALGFLESERVVFFCKQLGLDESHGDPR